jgi:glyoxylase I family protein
MKVWLHHINLCGNNVPELSDFYRNVMTLGDDEHQNLPPINQDKAHVGDVSFVTDGNIQLHLTLKDITNSFRSVRKLLCAIF